MKLIVLLWVICLAGPAAARSAQTPTLTFYVQLVRGSDDDKPPAPQARLIGAELGRRLHGVFRWKNYWEIKRQRLVLSTGEKARARMSSQREVEITLPGAGQMMVCVYVDGKLVRKRRQAVQTRFYITGGDMQGTQSWFIVVRSDKPADGDTAQSPRMVWPAQESFTASY